MARIGDGARRAIAKSPRIARDDAGRCAREIHRQRRRAGDRRPRKLRDGCGRRRGDVVAARLCIAAARTGDGQRDRVSPGCGVDMARVGDGARRPIAERPRITRNVPGRRAREIHRQRRRSGDRSPRELCNRRRRRRDGHVVRARLRVGATGAGDGKSDRIHSDRRVDVCGIRDGTRRAVAERPCIARDRAGRGILEIERQRRSPGGHAGRKARDRRPARNRRGDVVRIAALDVRSVVIGRHEMIGAAVGQPRDRERRDIADVDLRRVVARRRAVVERVARGRRTGGRVPREREVAGNRRSAHEEGEYPERHRANGTHRSGGDHCARLGTPAYHRHHASQNQLPRGTRPILGNQAAVSLAGVRPSALRHTLSGALPFSETELQQWVTNCARNEPGSRRLTRVQAPARPPSLGYDNSIQHGARQ